MVRRRPTGSVSAGGEVLPGAVECPLVDIVAGHRPGRTEGEALDQVHKNYVEMAIAGRVTEAQRRTFFSVGQHLCRAQDAEAVVLGGTDLFLAFEGQDCGFPVIDCADVHIEAIYQRSVGKA